jgi:hypothetical protein
VIYVYVNGVRRGPFREEQVQSFLRDGLLQSSDPASNGAEGELKSLASFTAPAPEIAVRARAAAPPPLSPSQPSRLPALPRESLGPYARATLAPNETPFYRTSLHWIVFVRFGVLAALTSLFLAMPCAIMLQAVTGWQIGWFALPLPAFMLVPPTLAYLSSELVITDARVLIKTGIVRRQTLEMFIAKVESIAIDQGFIARIFDYGTVTIRGTGGFEEPFETIARPMEFRNWVQRMQRDGQPARVAQN